MKNIVTRWAEAKASIVASMKTIRIAHYESMKDIKATCGQQVKDFKIDLGQQESVSFILHFHASNSGSVEVNNSLYYGSNLVTNNMGVYEEWPIAIGLANNLPAVTPRMIREACEKTL